MAIEIHLKRLHTAQKHIRVTAKRFNVLMCGRRFGKTTLAIVLIAACILAGQPCAWCAPTYKQLIEVWDILLDVFSPIITDKSEEHHSFTTMTGGVVDMWSLENAKAIRGRAYALVIIDEAAIVSNLEEIFERIIRPLLVDLKGSIYFLSTPDGRNTFYTYYCRGQDPERFPDWMSWRFSSYDNPHLDKAELDSLRATMTEAAFKQEILAEPVDDGGTVFRNLDAVLLAPTNNLTAHNGHTLVGGIDWGKENDFTSLSIGCPQCKHEVHLERFNGIDYATQRGRIEALSARLGVMLWHVELNSIGTPNFEMLLRAGLKVVGFKMSASSKPQFIDDMVLKFEQGIWKLLPDPVARMELELYAKRVNQVTYAVTYSAPSGMHDDTVIARGLMLRAAASVPQVRQQATRVSPLAEAFAR